MKYMVAIAAMTAATSAAADYRGYVPNSYQHESALYQLCTMQAKIAMMMADSKRNGTPPLILASDFEHRDKAMFEMATAMDRISTEYKELGLSAVAEKGMAWCMDNAETIVFRSRR